MRNGLIVLWMILFATAPATAQVTLGMRFPDSGFEIRLSLYPELVPVPGYPVYYAPRIDLNYFFYDGMYWVYQDDDWYASYWYSGPWMRVDRESVPLYVLRVPVRYYRHPPAYFRGWHFDAPPRWDEHWGSDWSQRHRGWDRWDRSSAPARAPLPSYQRQYAGDRYPQVEHQQTLQGRNYRYQPRDPVVRQYFPPQAAPSPAMPHRPQPSHRSGEQVERARPRQAPSAPAGPATQGRVEQPWQGSGPHERPEARAPGREIRGPERGRSPAERGQERAREEGGAHGRDHGR